MDAQDFDAEVARGLREYHARHGQASNAVAVPREVLEQLAAIQPVEEEQDYGPGRIVCPVCDAWMSMRWNSGKREHNVALMTHSDVCAAEWARKAL